MKLLTTAVFPITHHLAGLGESCGRVVRLSEKCLQGDATAAAAAA